MIDPILITGVPRSGTSMTAGIIYFCGAFGGAINGPGKRGGGMFGNATIQSKAVFPPAGDLRSCVENLIVQQGYANGQWFYKDTKLCLAWLEWYKAFPGARWVIVRREEEEIISSCIKTKFMKGFDTREGWKSWVGEYLKRFEEMKRAGLDMVEVWPTKFVGGDFTKIKKGIGELGLRWNEERVLNFVDPEL